MIGVASRQGDNMESILVVNADDFGLSESANTGILEAHTSGIVTSASLVVTTTALDHALNLAAHAPDLGLGLHFSLSAGRSAAPHTAVPRLTDDDGYLACRFTSLFRSLCSGDKPAILEQIGMELEAQIVRLLGLGIKPDHINGERHIHLLPGVIELVLDAAVRHGIGYVRVIDDVGFSYLKAKDVAMSVANGGFIKYALLRRLSRRVTGNGSNPAFDNMHYASLLFTGRMDILLPRILNQPPPGVTEIAVHPGHPGTGQYVGIGNAALTRYLKSPDRQHELDGCKAAAGYETTALFATFADVRSPPAPGCG